MGVRERSSQGKGLTSEDATYTSRKNRLLGCARPVVARSEKRGARSEEQRARVIFRTKLDELATRSKAGVGRGITEHLIL
jgi:hypothetical protein